MTSTDTHRPRYTTRIDTSGPNGNVFVIMATATAFLRKLGHSRTEIDAFAKRVMDSQSYADALSIIREFFPLDTDDDE